jgi:hypothetical protein
VAHPPLILASSFSQCTSPYVLLLRLYSGINACRNGRDDADFLFLLCVLPVFRKEHFVCLPPWVWRNCGWLRFGEKCK